MWRARPLLATWACPRGWALFDGGYYNLAACKLETGDVFGLHRRFPRAASRNFALVLSKSLPLQGY